MMKSSASRAEARLGANPPSSPTAVDRPASCSPFFSVWKISAPQRRASAKVGAPTGITMNSWKSIGLSACAPPFRMFIIGTGRVAGRDAADIAVERQAARLGGRLGHRQADAEDRVGAEPRLVRRAVERDHRRVDLGLVLGVHARHRRRRSRRSPPRPPGLRPCRASESCRRRASRPPRAPRSRRRTVPPPGRSCRRRAKPPPPPSDCRGCRESGGHGRGRWRSFCCGLVMSYEGVRADYRPVAAHATFLSGAGTEAARRGFLGKCQSVRVEMLMPPRDPEFPKAPISRRRRLRERQAAASSLPAERQREAPTSW